MESSSPPPIYHSVPTPPPPPPPRRRTGWVIYSMVVTVVLFFSVLLNLLLFAVVVGSGVGDGPFGAQRLRFQEELIGGDDTSRNKIAVIHLNGLISSSSEGMAIEDGIVGFIQEQLRQAIKDDDVKAIVLRINSPGGEVVASDMIYRAVRDADAQKPVVACIDSVGASGGLYVAVGARHITASDMTITGSIGVIMQTFSIGELADKVGLKFHTFKSGKYKDLLNPTRDPTPEEIQFVNEMVMSIYDKFVGIVASERHLDVDQLKTTVADGRVLLGEQAKEAGLIDETGYFDDAVATAMEFAEVDDARVVRYLLPFSLRNIFRFLGEAEPAKVEINVAPSRLRLQPGHFYFLPSYLFE